MNIQDIVAIDSHTHINHNSMHDSKPDSLLYDASYDGLKRINQAANVDIMICSTFASVLTTKVLEEENEYMHELSTKTDNLYQWVVIDPRNENTFLQAKRMLMTEKCIGIKIHPVCHQYSLSEFGDKIFSFASEYNAKVQIHPETDADYILPLADKYPHVTFIVAHMGSFSEESYANAIKFSKNKNVYADTSGQASTLNMVVEYMVNRVGSEHLLFGTDTYAAGFQRGRIEYALISDDDKKNILRDNAVRLFKLKL